MMILLDLVFFKKTNANKTGRGNYTQRCTQIYMK
jgi:hypothetical protein